MLSTLILACATLGSVLTQQLDPDTLADIFGTPPTPTQQPSGPTTPRLEDVNASATKTTLGSVAFYDPSPPPLLKVDGSMLQKNFGSARNPSTLTIKEDDLDLQTAFGSASNPIPSTPLTAKVDDSVLRAIFGSARHPSATEADDALLKAIFGSTRHPSATEADDAVLKAIFGSAGHPSATEADDALLKAIFGSARHPSATQTTKEDEAMLKAILPNARNPRTFHATELDDATLQAILASARDHNRTLQTKKVVIGSARNSNTTYTKVYHSDLRVIFSSAGNHWTLSTKKSNDSEPEDSSGTAGNQSTTSIPKRSIEEQDLTTTKRPDLDVKELEDFFGSHTTTNKPRLEDLTVRPTDSNRVTVDANGDTCQCVPYYLCDADLNGVYTTNTSTTGWGTLDVRLGERKHDCQESVERCCTSVKQNPASETPPTDGGQNPPDNGQNPPDNGQNPPDNGQNLPDNGQNLPDSGQNPPNNGQDPPNRPNSEPAPLPGCGIRNLNGIDFEIVGGSGSEAGFGEFPWVAALLDAHNNSYVGVGVLIHPSVVMTAAHIAKPFLSNGWVTSLKVRAGEWDTQTSKERLRHQERIVEEVYIHEAYNRKNLQNNVALLRLNGPVTLDRHINVICLPTLNENFDAARGCIANGWGKDVFGRPGRYAVILKKVEVAMVPPQTCQMQLRRTRLGPRFKLHESFLCAGGEEGKDTCQGDGGAPLACPTSSGRYTLTGLVSWGIGCGQKGVPAVYANVPAFRTWLDAKMHEWQFDEF